MAESVCMRAVSVQDVQCHYKSAEGHIIENINEDDLPVDESTAYPGVKGRRNRS